METKSSRKWLLTINNPEEHNIDADKIIGYFNLSKGNYYYCFCNEVGENGTPHIHLFVFRPSPIRFTTIKAMFPSAHIDKAMGTNQEIRAYILKHGAKFNKDEKGHYDYIDAKNVRHTGINYSDTFYENKECPEEYQGVNSGSRLIVEMVQAGNSDNEIIEVVPTAYKDLDKIQRVRSMFRDEKFRKEWRDITTIYIYGSSGAGKTRSVMDKYGYENVYRVTNYNHPFDGYDGQDVVIFEEFRSSLKYADMLNYLDGYPLVLPCRYFDRQACYTKVFIISNVPPHEQYPKADNESFKAFWRRVNEIQHFVKNDYVVTYSSYENYLECER